MNDIQISTTVQCSSGTTDDLVEVYNSRIKVFNSGKTALPVVVADAISFVITVYTGNYTL